MTDLIGVILYRPEGTVGMEHQSARRSSWRRTAACDVPEREPALPRARAAKSVNRELAIPSREPSTREPR